MFLRRFGLLLMLLVAKAAFSQISANQNPDSLLREAIVHAADGKYDEALKTTSELASMYPDNLDYAIATGRIYTWKGDHENAVKYLTAVYSKNPNFYYTLEALVDACVLGGNYELAILHCDRGIVDFPEQKNFFLIRKATSLSKQQKDDEALGILDQLLVTDPENQAAMYLRTQILRKQKNLLTLSYQNTSFAPAGTAPWHLGYLEYKRNFAKAPTVFRVNYAHLFGLSGLQYEADLYPKLSKNRYLYLNAGFSSGGDIFPGFRGGAEYCRGFGKKVEASLGVRYLKFSQQDVTMLTGNISWFKGTWAFSYRPFLAFINDKSYLSNGVSVKRMNETKENFLQFDVQYGIVPYTFFFSNEINRTGTLRFGVQYQWRIKDNFFVKPFLLYEYEEFMPDNYRNRFNVQLTLSRRF